MNDARVVITSAEGFAARAGFRPGDVVREVNGQSVATVRDLAAALAGAARWRLVVERGGERVVAQF